LFARNTKLDIQFALLKLFRITSATVRFVAAVLPGHLNNHMMDGLSLVVRDRSTWSNVS